MKFMRNLDGVSNLEAVVIHDLRDIGVKIPKIRKQIHSVVSVSTRASGKGCVCGGKGYFAECGLRNAESCQRVICRKFDADFFCGMKGKVWNESMRYVTGMNIS